MPITIHIHKPTIKKHFEDKQHAHLIRKLKTKKLWNIFRKSIIKIKVLFKKTSSATTPLWPSVGVKPNTPKVGDLESSGTPECLEFDSKAENTSH